MIATKTVSMSAGSIPCQWYVIDAKGQILGRLVSKIAHILMGKHKPEFTPHADIGDYVIVINADKVRVTGNKLEQKLYYRHTGAPGGLKATSLKQLLATHPTRVIEFAVKGMLSKNSLGRTRFKKLFVYKDDTHPHMAQQPQALVVETEK